MRSLQKLRACKYSLQVIIQNVGLSLTTKTDRGLNKSDTENIRKPCHNIDDYKTMQNDRELTNLANDLSVNHELILFRQYDLNYYVAFSITQILSRSIISRWYILKFMEDIHFLEPSLILPPCNSLHVWVTGLGCWHSTLWSRGE